MHQKQIVMLFAVSDKGSGSRAFFYASHNDHHIYPHQHHMIKRAFSSPAAWVKIQDQFVQLQALNAIGDQEYERLKSIPHLDIDIFLIIFSVVSPKSFEEATSKWYQLIRNEKPEADVIFVGTKTHLRDASRKNNHPVVELWQARTIVENNLRCRYLECSAQTGEGVREIYEQAVKMVVAKKAVRRHRAEEYNCDCQLI